MVCNSKEYRKTTLTCCEWKRGLYLGGCFMKYRTVENLKD